MKRLLGWLCAVLLVLTPVFAAFGEAEITAEAKSGTAVFYLHATRNEEQIKSAKYVIYALCAKNETDGGEMLISRIDGGTNRRPLYRSSDSSWANQVWAQNQQLFSTGQGNYFTAASALNEEQLAAVSGFADLWLIVQEDAYAPLLDNPELLSQLRGLLENRQLRIHLVLAGDGIPDPTAGGTLDRLIAAYPDRVEWVRILSDFQAQQTKSTAHTGDFFLASLFGTSETSPFLETPADLVLSVPSEENWDGDAGRAFTLPEDGRILVLTRYTGVPAELTVMEQQGGKREAAKQYSLSFVSSGNGDFSYTGTLVTQLPAGEYALNGCSEETKVYWYPDPEELQPVFSMGEEEWKWGEHCVFLTLSNTLNRPNDFTVDFTQLNNDEKSSRYSVSYSTENRRWELKVRVTADSGILKVQMTPAAKLLMADGNLIWSWEGEPQSREPQSTPSEEKEDAVPDAGTLYFTEQAGGEFGGEWSDFFSFNEEEPYSYEVKRGETVPEEEILISWGNSGFKLSAVPGTGEGGNGSITLVHGGAEHVLMLAWKNAQSLFINENIEATDDTESKAIPVGKNVTLTVKIPAAIREAWETAWEQLKESGFPGIQALILTGKIMEENENGAETEPEEQSFTVTPDGDLSAEIRIRVPEDFREGNARLVYQVTDTSAREPAALFEDERNLQIQNHAPEIRFDGKSKIELSLEGMPDRYEPGDLLETAFGTGNLFELFSDTETESVREIEISVNHSSGLQINGETPEEPQEEWTATLTNPEESLKVQVLQPGDYTVTLNASDGVNTTGPLSVTVHAYSRILRIAMFAAAGLALAVAVLVLILVIRHARKPQFADIKLRCYVSSDENAERGREIMTKCQPVSMARFGKKPVTLTDLLILTRQPSLSPEAAETADDITILPTRHGEINVLFGKKAMERIGRHEKRDLITQNNVCRLRIDNQYIQIENVQ